MARCWWRGRHNWLRQRGTGVRCSDRYVVCRDGSAGRLPVGRLSAGRSIPERSGRLRGKRACYRAEKRSSVLDRGLQCVTGCLRGIRRLRLVNRGLQSVNSLKCQSRLTQPRTTYPDTGSAPGVWTTGPAFTAGRAEGGLAYDAGDQQAVCARVATYRVAVSLS